MLEQAFSCDQCRESDVQSLADYILTSEEDTLAGPSLGDPDYWHGAPSRRRALCRRHYRLLSADARLDYQPISDEFSPIL